MKLFEIFNTKKPASPAPAQPPPAPTPKDPLANLPPMPVMPDNWLAPAERPQPPKFRILPPAVRIQHLHVPPPFLEKICALATEPLVADDEKAELARLQTEYFRAESYLLAHVAESAKSAWARQQEKLSADVRSGQVNVATDFDSWSLADFQEDFQQRRRSLKDACRQISGSALPISYAVAARVGELAGQIAVGIEADEKKFADAWAVPFLPSRVLTLLEYVSKNSDRLVQPHGATPPAKALAFIGITITN